MTCNIFSTPVYPTSRDFISSSRTAPTVQGPVSHNTAKISNSPAVGCLSLNPLNITRDYNPRNEESVRRSRRLRQTQAGVGPVTIQNSVSPTGPGQGETLSRKPSSSLAFPEQRTEQAPKSAHNSSATRRSVRGTSRFPVMSFSRFPSAAKGWGIPMGKSRLAASAIRSDSPQRGWTSGFWSIPSRKVCSLSHTSKPVSF